MNGWAVFLVVVVVLAALSGAGFFAYVRIYKKKYGAQRSANYPAPAPSGIVGWINDKFAALKRGRFQNSNAGYEPSGGGVFGRGGTANAGGGAYGRSRGAALDPDEAWDSRVDNEAYFEEQELGLHAPTGYTGAGYTGQTANPYEQPGAPVPDGPRGRELDKRYEEETRGAAGKRASNPFGDEHAAPSLRGVSPRPLDTSHAGGSGGHGDNSPTERKSVFRENMS